MKHALAISCGFLAGWAGAGITFLAAFDEGGLRPIEDCAMSMDEARTEDELCSTWLDNGKVVFGPLWAKEGES